MAKDNYHFHKDCKYYSQCTEELVKEGKQERIRFKCPMWKYPVDYFKGDIHSIKWECGRFEPYQPNFIEGLNDARTDNTI